MAKKKKVKKAKKVKKTKKIVKKKKAVRGKKKAVKKVVRKKKVAAKAAAKPAKKGTGEKKLAAVDHFFGHISVAAFKLKAPLEVGDTIHIKGHTTDFTQKIESIQIEHQSILKAKAGDEVGIKVKDKVRTGDTVYLAAKGQGFSVQPARAASTQPFVAAPLFQKPVSQPVVKPAAPPPPPKTEMRAPEGPNPYADKKFFKF
jgi:putative protease